jgi:hypothetical protein
MAGRYRWSDGPHALNLRVDLKRRVSFLIEAHFIIEYKPPMVLVQAGVIIHTQLLKEVWGPAHKRGNI